jgi:predicted ATPase
VPATVQAAEFLYETRLFPDQIYMFKHALTHEVAYGSLLQERRLALHAQIVEALETLAGDRRDEQVDLLAQHARLPVVPGTAATQPPPVDIRAVASLPAAQRLADVLVMAPAELIMSKVQAYYQRRGRPKSGTDWCDLALLFLTFPKLKHDPGPVRTCLEAGGADPAVLAVWQELVTQEIQIEDEEAW